MLRRLLACLALLTGLAAAGAPAQAELVTALATRMEVGAAAQPGPGSVAIAQFRELPRRVEPAIVGAPVQALKRRAPAPAVFIGSDRARE